MDCSYARRDSIGNDSNVNRNKWFTKQMPIRMLPVFSYANHNNGYKLKLINILFSMSYIARGRFPSSPWLPVRHSRKTKRTLPSHDFTFETHVQSPLGAVLRYSFTTERVLSLTRDRQTLTSRYFRVTTPYTTANRNRRWATVGRMKSPINLRPRGSRYCEKYATKLFLCLF